jgi:hypothetical protein
MTSKLLFSLAILGMLTTVAQAQGEPVATASTGNLAVPTAPTQVRPSMNPEAYARDVMCQSGYVDEAIAHCIAAQTPVAAPATATVAAATE